MGPWIVLKHIGHQPSLKKGINMIRTEGKFCVSLALQSIIAAVSIDISLRYKKKEINVMFNAQDTFTIQYRTLSNIDDNDGRYQI